ARRYARAMNVLCIAWAVAALLVAAGPCRAESLRCNGSIASEGDSRLSVFYKCAPPLLQDTRCPTVFYSGTWQPVPEPFASTFVPCQPVEEWLYERGPGNLTATVRVRAGGVQSDRAGREPQ